MSGELVWKEIYSEVLFFFEGDQTAISEPLYQEGEEKLGKAFGFAQVQLHNEPSGPRWQAIHGKLESIKIVVATGHVNILQVQVLGETEDANKALNAVWKELSGEEISEECGMILHKTTAMVQSPFRFVDLFPNTGLPLHKIEESLAKKSLKPQMPPTPTLQWDIRVAVGPHIVSLPFQIVPRNSYSKTDRVFITQSPLPSDQHKQLVKEIIEQKSRQKS